MNSSQVLDLVILGTLVYCAWKGASRGLVSQAASVVALILCFKFSGELAPAVEPVIAVAQPLKKWIAMAIVYLGLCLVSFVAAGILNSWLEKAQLKDFDRHLGALLGFLKGVVVCMTAMFFGLTLSESLRGVISQSRSGYAAATLMHHLDPLLPLVPDGAKETVMNVVRTFNENLNREPGRVQTEFPAEEKDPWTPRASDRSGVNSSQDGTADWWDKTLSGLNGRSPDDSVPDSRPQSEFPSPTAADPSLSDFLSQLPAIVRDEITAKTIQELRSSTSQQKQRLLEELRNAAPDEAGEVMDDFVRARTDQKPSVTPGWQSPGLSRSNTAILEQISEIYRNSSQVENEAKQFLGQVPEAVQRGVLEDWYADVMQLQNDPDPETGSSTLISDRILRQLSRSGVSLDSLDRNLRQRLSRSGR